MRRHVILVVLSLLLLSVCADAAMPNPFRRKDRARGDYFPENGDVPDLVRAGNVVKYTPQKFTEFYGAGGNRYIQYGLLNMMACEYIWGGKDRRVTIEISTMESPTAAAGLFHHHRGNVLDGRGTAVDVGAEGVLDTKRGNRNMYLYRSNIFVKIIYAGRDPVPDLTLIGEYIDSQLPTGRDLKPDGFAYIGIDGVNEDTISLTAGFTFNLSFLPAAVWASAPGGGSAASDLFIITRQLDRDAAQLYQDYTSYIKLYAEYFEEYKRGRQPYTKAVDPNQGRVVFTHYRNALIIAARPDGYEKGEALIDKVMAKMDEESPDPKKKGGGGLFRRKGKKAAGDDDKDGKDDGE